MINKETNSKLETILWYILILPGIIMGLSIMTGIGGKEECIKVYAATSTTEEGRNLIKEYNVKCVAKDVMCACFIDWMRGETFFAYNVDHNNYFFYENVKYQRIPDDYVVKYKIVPEFTWLEKNGKYFFNSYFIILLSFAIFYISKFWLFKKKRSIAA